MGYAQVVVVDGANFTFLLVNSAICFPDFLNDWIIMMFRLIRSDRIFFTFIFLTPGKQCVCLVNVEEWLNEWIEWMNKWWLILSLGLHPISECSRRILKLHFGCIFKSPQKLSNLLMPRPCPDLIPSTVWGAWDIALNRSSQFLLMASWHLRKETENT